ncbi:MAG TPA: epoxyqueuosine reductase QueH [Candidatus Eisenbergiella intestinipullorum]|nr:epoxyqueuosine reductase QueH [Candidatus Eisenbergiella intestinipullorum]
MQNNGCEAGCGKRKNPQENRKNQVNYQKELEKILRGLEAEEASGGRKKRLLLHACCAPCSSYVLEYLREKFEITVLYYNPNITERGEYEKRCEELKRLAERMNEERFGAERAEEGWSRQERELSGEMPRALPSGYLLVEEGEWEPKRFFEVSKGLENLPEGGERCFRCYELRLRETARLAAERGFDYFTTTLTISPLKNAAKLNEIGERMAEEYGVAFLPSDFKKKNGYKRSVELSEEYGLYRQDYCGCIFSRAERDRRKAAGQQPDENRKDRIV